MAGFFINIADLRDPDDPQGRSYRQVNLARTHTIPVGSLVEMLPERDEDQDRGQRMFVVHHGRDCDGTPLYYLAFNRNDTTQERSGFRNPGWQGGFAESSLRVIRQPGMPPPPYQEPTQTQPYQVVCKERDDLVAIIGSLAFATTDQFDRLRQEARKWLGVPDEPESS